MRCWAGSVDDDGSSDDALDDDAVTVKFLRPAKPEISLPVRSPSSYHRSSKSRKNALLLLFSTMVVYILNYCLVDIFYFKIYAFV